MTTALDLRSLPVRRDERYYKMGENDMLDVLAVMGAWWTFEEGCCLIGHEAALKVGLRLVYLA